MSAVLVKHLITTAMHYDVCHACQAPHHNCNAPRNIISPHSMRHEVMKLSSRVKLMSCEVQHGAARCSTFRCKGCH